VDAARSGGRIWRLIAPDQLEMGFSERLAHEAMPTPKSAEVRRIGDRIADFDAVVRTLFAEAAGSADAAVTSATAAADTERSEERRVGKDGTSRRPLCHVKSSLRSEHQQV